ncbi:MAG: hypothetical protein ACF8R7_09545 [Phycisphaerales bacterium JB039]
MSSGSMKSAVPGHAMGGTDELALQEHCRPAALGVRRLAAAVAAMSVIVLLAAAVVGALTHPAAGAVTGILGLLLLLTNPEVWANLLGARRQRGDDDGADGH